MSPFFSLQRFPVAFSLFASTLLRGCGCGGGYVFRFQSLILGL